MRSYWIKVDPKSNLTGVLIRRGKFGHRCTRTGRRPCEDGGGDWSNISTSKEKTRIASDPRSQARGKAGSSPRACRGSRALPTP